MDRKKTPTAVSVVASTAQEARVYSATKKLAGAPILLYVQTLMAQMRMPVNVHVVAVIASGLQVCFATKNLVYVP